MHVVHLHIYTLLIIFTLFIIPVNAELFHSLRRYFGKFKHNNNVSGIVEHHEGKHVSLIMKSVNKTKHMIKRDADQQSCSDDQLMTYLAEVEVVNPENIINLSTLEELPLVCKQVTDALEGMETYLKTCKVPDEKDLYMQLLRGIARFVDVMCEKETKTKKAYMEHFTCLRDLHQDFENCYGPADWTEYIKKSDICCAYHQIADCYYIKAAKVCGVKAAHAMKKVVTTIIDAVIPVHCTLVLEPCVKDAAPDTSSSLILPNQLLVIVLLTSFIFIIKIV